MAQLSPARIDLVEMFGFIVGTVSNTLGSGIYRSFLSDNFTGSIWDSVVVIRAFFQPATASVSLEFRLAFFRRSCFSATLVIGQHMLDANHGSSNNT